jgi:hypothetical protein
MTVTLTRQAVSRLKITCVCAGDQVGFCLGTVFDMATWEDVRRAALALPETTERSGTDGRPDWQVHGKTFAWERPLRKGDLAALGAAAPDGPVLAARVPDEGAKAALLADDPAVYFSTPHFNGYPAILVRLDVIDSGELGGLLVDAWLARAPKRLAASYLEDSGTGQQ